MTYLLDTNAVIAILNRRPDPVRERLRRVLAAGEQVSVSSVVLFELAYGVARSANSQENAERLRIFMAGQIDLLPFSAEDALQAGSLRASLERGGTPIGPYDTLIAGQALRHRCILVTANHREFSRVPDLALEDWSQA